MSVIKEIIDLTENLESRMKDRRDIDTLKQIHSLVFSLQSAQLEIMERDIKLVQENAGLKAKLAESQSEEIRIIEGIEFRKGSRTGGFWDSFCPKCHMPTIIYHDESPVGCSVTSCDWSTEIYRPEFEVIKNRLNA